MGDDIAAGTEADTEVATAAGITPLGHDVFEIDTRIAGYRGITAGYLIRADRPCLVETGTAPSAPVVRDALASLGVGPASRPGVPSLRVPHPGTTRAGGYALRQAG